MFRDKVERLQYLRGQIPTCADVCSMLEWADVSALECKMLLCGSCKSQPQCLLCREIYMYMIHMDFVVSDAARAELCVNYQRLLAKYASYGQIVPYLSLQIMEQTEEVANFCAYIHGICENLRKNAMMQRAATILCNWMINKQLRDIVVALILKYGLVGCVAKLSAAAHLAVSLYMDM